MTGEIIKQTVRGKTVNRILMNLKLKNFHIKGDVLDLGGGNRRSSYFDYLSRDGEINVSSIDMLTNRDPDQIANLEEGIPASDESFDNVLCFNLLEHIYNYQNLINESSRVLKSGGQLIGYVPFLVKFHPDPNDFFRYTHSALENILGSVGFKNIKIIFIGFGPLTASWSQLEFILPYFLRWIITIPIIWFDKILLKFKPIFRNTYVLGYVFRAER